MSGYYISVYTGLIDPKHIKNMQVSQKTSAVWMYLWFLDKVTKIDGEKMGLVLGGKPFKLEDFCRDMKMDIKTARKMFHALVEHDYIKATRTPYGNRIEVTKAKKIFGLRISESGRSSVRNVVGLVSESGRSNKTRQLDNTVRHKEIYKEITEQDVLDISSKYNVTPGFVMLQVETLKNYCESKGKTYKDYRAALRNFVLGDMKKQAERRSYGTSKVSIDPSQL